MLEIRAFEMMGDDIGDALVLLALPERILKHEDIGCVTTDEAHDTDHSHADHRARAVIPPRKNASPT